MTLLSLTYTFYTLTFIEYNSYNKKTKQKYFPQEHKIKAVKFQNKLKEYKARVLWPLFRYNRHVISSQDVSRCKNITRNQLIIYSDMPSYPCLADFPPLSSHQMESKHTRVLPSCEALQDFDYDTQPPASRLLLACFKQTLLPSRLSVSIFCTCANSLGNSSCFACEFS